MMSSDYKVVGKYERSGLRNLSMLRHSTAGRMPRSQSPSPWSLSSELPVDCVPNTTFLVIVFETKAAQANLEPLSSSYPPASAF